MTARLIWLFLLFASFVVNPSAESSSSCKVLKVPGYFDGQRMFRQGPYFISIEKDVIRSLSKDLGKSPCELISLDDVTLSPGLIDAHVHLFLEDKSHAQNFAAELLKAYNLDVTQRRRAARQRAKEMLRSGFTSVRDLGNSGSFLDLELKKEIEQKSGLGPRLFVSGPAFVVGEGQFPLGTTKKKVKQEYQVVEDLEKAASQMADLKKRGVDWIKIYADNDPTPKEMPTLWMKRLVDAARKENLRIAIHATSEASAKRAAEAGADSLEHVYEVSLDTLRLMAEKKIFLVPTDFDSSICSHIRKFNPDPYYEVAAYKKRRSKRLTAAQKAGVPVAFGSDMYLASLETDRGQGALLSFFSLVEHGLSSEQALKAATFTNAKLLGRTDLGVIAEGAKADLIAFAGDPLRKAKLLKEVVFVMKAGEVICSSKRSCGGSDED